MVRAVATACHPDHALYAEKTMIGKVGQCTADSVDLTFHELNGIIGRGNFQFIEAYLFNKRLIELTVQFQFIKLIVSALKR